MKSNTSYRPKVLIIGGGYAGLLAATRAARARGVADVALIDTRPEFHQRIRMHELLTGHEPVVLPYQPLLERRGVAFHQARVTGIDLSQGRVTAESDDGAVVEYPYDYLVLALGSGTRARVPGVKEHAVRLDRPEDVHQAAERLKALPPGTPVVVCGGGLTGLEVATEVAERYPHLATVLVTSGSLTAAYAPAAGDYVRRRLATLRIALHEHTTVAAVEADRVVGDGREWASGMTIWCGGFEANPLPRAMGLPVDAVGRVFVDEMLRVRRLDNVFVAGDGAAIMSASGALRMCAAVALPSGAHVGDNIARLILGRSPKPFRFGFAVRAISLGRGGALIQRTTAQDEPLDGHFRGMPAAFLKELVCRMTVAVIRAEYSTGLRLYRWPRGRQTSPAMIVTTPARA